MERLELEEVVRLSPTEAEAYGYKRHGGLDMVFVRANTGAQGARLLDAAKMAGGPWVEEQIDAGRLHMYALARHSPKKDNWTYSTVATYDPVTRRFDEMRGRRESRAKSDDTDLFYRVLIERLRYGANPARPSTLQAVAAAGLTAIGIGGVVLGLRARRDAAAE